MVVEDRMLREWCEFDPPSGQEFQFQTVSANGGVSGNGMTYDWYLANKIVQLNSTYPIDDALGNGNMYDGGLLLDSGDCSLGVTHSIVDGYVVTNGVLRKRNRHTGEEQIQQLGILFDNNMNYNSSIVLDRHEMDPISGLISRIESSSITPTQMFILKDMDGGWNNVNTICVDKSVWDSSIVVYGGIGYM